MIEPVDTTVDTRAAGLDEAARTATAIEQLTATGDLDVAGAYQVQQELVRLRVQRGERLIGLKMGLTSRVKMAQVGVDEVIWGRLTDAMAVPHGGTLDPSTLIHPRIEPEVAFRLTGSWSLPSAVSAVAPALEVIDSRYRDFRFTLPDVIADNCSAAAFVVGGWQPVPARLDNLGVLLEVDGRVVDTGSTAAILGDPWHALAEGLALARRAGIEVHDGWVFLAGAATAAVPLRPGANVRAVVQDLGTASAKVAL